jgi:pilus assembly protein Flp/PilA
LDWAAPGMIDFIRTLFRSRRGATAVEYGLILCLIVVAAMVAVMSLADTTVGMWGNIASNVLAH